MTSKKTTKKDLVEAVYQNTDKNTEKRLIQVLFDNLLDEIKNSLLNGQSIELRGFGTFEPKLRKGRDNARNPKTGEILSVQSRYTVVFKPGKELKENLSKLLVEHSQE